ncbi:MAG: phytanoyl-CoA dioxygenase family protein [Rhodobacteraceae bacterium]|nr:phytanoyl-CoA dioxygenase family protein [Paracoccaceae bacterium]
MTLDQSQIERFHREGVLVVENVVGESILTGLWEEYSGRMDQLYADWHADGFVGQPRSGMDFWEKLDACCAGGFDWFQSFDISLPHADIRADTPMHFGPAVFNLVTCPGILDVVESLIGGEITSNPIQHVRIKPPERRVPGNEIRAHVVSTDWHQDRGVTLESADNTEMVTVWVAVTDATVNNGCLQVIPRVNHEMFPHCQQSQPKITDTILSKEGAVPVPVGAGGIVLLHPLTPHASLSNHSDGYRWSFDLRYNVTGQSTGREQFPSFVARSRSNPSAELDSWQEWKGMWEACRANLASAPHIPQHRWASEGPACA